MVNFIVSTNKAYLVVCNVGYSSIVVHLGTLFFYKFKIYLSFRRFDGKLWIYEYTRSISTS